MPIAKRFGSIFGASWERQKRGVKRHWVTHGSEVIRLLKEVKYIDQYTGEIKYNKVKPITAAFDEEKGYLFWARKSFAKSFTDVPFPDEMTDLEIGRMARLAKKIWSSTNMLGYRSNGTIKPYDTQKLSKELKIGIRQTQRFIDKMIKLGVMAKVDVTVGGVTETQLYVNPIYFFSSNRIPLNLYLIFRKQLDKELPDWVKNEYAKQQSG